jgi:hypothetical protein
MEKTNIGLDLEAKVRSTDEINKQFLPGEVGCVLDWEVKDTLTGEVVESRIKKAESFTRQFFDLLLTKFWNIPFKESLLITDITGVSREITNSHLNLSTNAGAGTVTYGIVVGLSSNAVHITDYALNSPIAHDSGAHGVNTLQYSIVTYGAPASDPTTSQFTITRNFANATAGGVNVQEIGLYARGLNSNFLWSEVNAGAATYYYFMTIHDVTGGITVGVGQTLTVNYRPQCVV